MAGGRTSGQSALAEILNGDAPRMNPDLRNCYIEIRVFWHVTPCASCATDSGEPAAFILKATMTT